MEYDRPIQVALAEKLAFGIVFSWRSLPYNRFRLTVNERRIAAGQKAAATAVLARFVQVYDDDGTLLAGPTADGACDAAARPAPQRSRVWLQFDLRSLLLLAVVVSCAASCYGIHCRRVLPQTRAAAQLGEFVATVTILATSRMTWISPSAPKKPDGRWSLEHSGTRSIS